MSHSTDESSTTGTKEIVLFGVHLTIDSMRKSVSLNNISQYVHPQDDSASSTDEVVAVQHRSPSSSANAANRDRKRVVPWTEEEHKMFLLGLQKVGKGDWRGIARNYVKTRTPTQVASHAQKYFLRRSNSNRRCRRSSLFDITTETVSTTSTKYQHANKNDTNSQSPRTKVRQGTSSEISMVRFSAPHTHPVASPPQVDQIMSKNVPVIKDYMIWRSTTNTHHQMNLMTNVPVGPIATTNKSMVNLDLNKNSMMTDSSSLSLNLSLSLSSNESKIPRQSPLHAMPSFFNGDGMVTVG